MALVGLTTFSAKVKLLAAQLNQFKTVLEAKFNGGISGADLGWPFTANGNLNMNGNQILRVSRFRNVYNIAEHTANIQGLFDTVAAAGGGTIYVPANTTIDMAGITCTVAGGLHIYGEGQTSILRKAGGSVTDMLRLSCTGGLTISNLKFDGNSVGSATNALLRMSTCTNARLEMVTFENAAGFGTLLDYISAPGSGSANVYFSMCRWYNHTANTALRIEDAQNVFLQQCTFQSNTRICVEMAPQSAAAYAKNINIRDCFFYGPASVASQTILFRDNTAAAPVALQFGLSIRGCTFEIVNSGVQAMIEAWYCDYFNFTDNRVQFTGVDRPVIYLRRQQYAVINDNMFTAAGGDAIVIGHIGRNDNTTISEGIRAITVTGNNCATLGGKFLVLGDPRNFKVMSNLVEVGNSLALAGPVNMIELWSVGDGAAASLNLAGTVCFNSHRTSGYNDVLGATQSGYGGVSSNIGGGGFNSRFICMGNINLGVAVSATGGLTNAGDINDTVIADAHVNELNVGA